MAEVRWNVFSVCISHMQEDWKNTTTTAGQLLVLPGQRRRRHVGEARGLLRQPQTPGGHFHHARLAPSPELAALVQHFWIVRWDLRGHPPQTRENLPHPNVHLTLVPGESCIYGVQTGRFTRVLQGRGGVFGIKFRPGAFRPFLKRSVSSLRNRTMVPRDLFNAAADGVEAAVAAASPDDAAMTAAAEDFLLAHLPPADPEVDLVAGIVDEVAADRGLTRVEHILERHGLRIRTLQRLFNQYVGVGPKWVINRYRLHEAVDRLALDHPVDWAEFALDLGYFDQAHFIRDFKAVTGRTPADYVAGTGIAGKITSADAESRDPTAIR
jgi:AraC-like DNA-binding protein